MKKTAKIIASLLLGSTVVLNVISYFYLPAQLIMQRRLDGSAGTTMPTLVGLIVLTALVALFAVRLISSSEDKLDVKSIVAGGAILIVNVIIIIYNVTM